MLDAWFPYADKQALIFKSTENLYDTLYLQISDSTVSYEYSTGLGRPDNGCNASKSFMSTKRDSSNYPAFSITLNSAQDAYSTTQKRSTSINFKNKYFYGQDLSDNGFGSFSLSDGTYKVPQTMINYSSNGKVFPIAQSVVADSSMVKSTGVYKIIYAKNYGIIAYETNPGGIVWVKQ